MEKISDWRKINRLSLNIKKTHFILFRNRQKKIESSVKLKINGNEIEQVEFTKFLGVIINENLTWSNHILSLISKVSKNIGVIRRVSKILPKDVLFTLYNSMIMPYLEYCNIAWATNDSVLFGKLFILQKKVVRVISGSLWNSHTNPIFMKNNLLKLRELNVLQVGLFMFKFVNNMIPASFAHFFVFNKDIHQHDTRIKNNIHQIQFRTNLRGSCIKVYGPKIWNSIPNAIKNLKTLYSFKKQFKKDLIQKYL